MQDKSDFEEFSQIVNPKEVNVKLFCKACEQKEPQTFAEFILSIEKILKLCEKPGRTNPFNSLSLQNLNLITEHLKKAAQKLTLTVYQIKIKSILDTIQSTRSQKSIPALKRDENEKKRDVQLTFDTILADYNSLNGKFDHPRTLYQFVISDVLKQIGRQILAINDHEKREEAVLKGLQLCDKLIHPTEVEIQISKNTLLESRTFKMKYQYAFQVTQTIIIRKARNIINEALLCPSNQKIQGLLLRLLKRMYRLWGDLVHGPLFLNLRNISLFFKDEPITTKMLKEAAIFCYSVNQLKTDIKLTDMLMSSEDLGQIKRHEYFSSKGIALSFQIGITYDNTNLSLPIWKFRRQIEKRQTLGLTVIVEKSNSLLYWKFQIQAYDISFGIYKVNSLVKYTTDDYEQGRDCKQIIKLSKHESSNNNRKSPSRGQIFLKTGVYHIVFDNSHSIVRGKTVYLEYSLLESIS